jgi:hypothetical protein
MVIFGITGRVFEDLMGIELKHFFAFRKLLIF